MGNMIIVDFETLQDNETRRKVKNLVIEHMIRHPATLLTVLNSNYQALPAETLAQLSVWEFPKDGVAVNPLSLKTPDITFKTMFAASIDDRAEHRVVLVIDNSGEALSMWKSSGVPFVYQPVAEPKQKRKAHG